MPPKLNVRKQQTGCGILNYKWGLIGGSEMLSESYHLTARRCISCLPLSHVFVLSVLEIPFPTVSESWCLMEHKGLWEAPQGLVLHSSGMEEIEMYMVFSHLSKTGKNLNWHFISNELWTVYFVPKGTTTKLDSGIKGGRESERDKNSFLIKHTVISMTMSDSSRAKQTLIIVLVNGRGFAEICKL